MKLVRKILIPPLLVALCVALMMLLRRRFPIIIFFHFPYTFIGIPPILAGIVISFLGGLRLWKKGTAVTTFGKPARLVTDGVYKYSRNPIYLGFAIALGGVLILVDSLAGIAVWILFVVLADRLYIRPEEEILAKRFGREFEEYKSRTRRWI